MMKSVFLAGAIAATILRAAAADFATPGGPAPANLDEVARTLDAEGSAMELLLSFGTSKGGSAGHLALALREPSGTEQVHSANFYADRDPAHERDRYTEALIVSVPKWEYLYGTTSSLGPKASFGLDYGEVYKRSVIGVRVYGVPPAEREALAAYLERMNADFRERARDTEYQRGEVKYSYTDLNCAKTIGSAFRYGAGYSGLEVRGAPLIALRKAKAALNANTPSEMAVNLMRELDARGYRMDAVLYRKYPGSPYVDPHDEEPIAFGKLPNRIPSVVSLDFRNDDGHFEDYDNLFASYLLHNVGRHLVVVDPQAQAVRIELTRTPMAYGDAAQRAAKDAEADSKGFLRRLLFRPRGSKVDE
jgi:hypothetical protein